MPDLQSTKTPWHLWVVGVLSLFWNAMGAMDFTMTQTKNETYMNAFTPEQLEFFYGFPIWVDISWAVAVWASVLGSLILLFRKAFAVPVFLASVLGMIITVIHNYGLSNGFEVTGDAFSLIFTAMIFTGATFLYFYSRKMRGNGVLR